MKLLVTGANGYIGGILENGLCNANHQILSVMRSEVDKYKYRNKTRLRVEDYKNADWSAILDQVDCVILAHGANVIPDGDWETAKNEQQIASAICSHCNTLKKPFRIILLSSIRVQSISGQRPKTSYELMRKSIEDIWFNELQNSLVDLHVVRLAQVYGELEPISKGGVLGKVYRMLKHPILVPIGNNNFVKHVLHARNLLSAVQWTITYAAKSSKAKHSNEQHISYIVQDKDLLCSKDILEFLLSLSDTKAKGFILSATVIRILQKCCEYFIKNSAMASYLRWQNNEENIEGLHDLTALGWEPSFTTRQSLVFSFGGKN